MNAKLFCLLGNDEVLSYEDTCSFTCNTGYELSGSNTRTCQSNGSWSGSDVVCSNIKSFDIIIGVVLGSLFILLILVILICGIMRLKNRGKHQLRSTAVYGKGIHIVCKYAKIHVVVILSGDFTIFR